VALPGVWTHGFYDGWARTKFYVANGTTRSAGSTRRLAVRAPTPAFATSVRSPNEIGSVPTRHSPGQWLIRNNDQHAAVGDSVAMNYVANQKDRFP